MFFESPRPSVLALAATLGITVPSLAVSEAPPPTLEGPVPGTPFVAATQFDLAEVGYEEAEYFLSGTASAYTNAAPLTSDGMWTATPGETAPYKTRILVYRPTRRAKFNGTVVVEWLNVSGGVDSGPDWISAHTGLTRAGTVWVGVSAQYVGVEGGGGIVGVVDLPLKTVDPARYGSLHHPGDSFSYDIFSQAGRAVREPTGTSPLGGLVARRVIAAGESQSAFRLVTYINAIHPLAEVYDGFLVHSRGGDVFLAPLSQPPQPAIAMPSPVLMRTDLRVPVLTFQTETDLTLLGSHAARQPDTDMLRLWEVAGTAHADTYTALVGFTDRGDSPEAAKIVISTEIAFGFITCPSPVNSGPQHFVLNAAFAALDRWVRTGKPPARVPRLEVDPGPPVSILRDKYGNALGGIRTPHVDVPIATFTGEQGGSLLCRLFGSTTLFDPPTLASLYPTQRAYVSTFRRATQRAVRAGAVLIADARLLNKAAALTPIGD